MWVRAMTLLTCLVAAPGASQGADPGVRAEDSREERQAAAIVAIRALERRQWLEPGVPCDEVQADGRSYLVFDAPSGSYRADSSPRSEPREVRVTLRHESRLGSPWDFISKPVVLMEVESGSADRRDRTTYRVETREQPRNDPWAFMSESRTVVVLREE